MSGYQTRFTVNVGGSTDADLSHYGTHFHLDVVWLFDAAFADGTCEFGTLDSMDGHKAAAVARGLDLVIERMLTNPLLLSPSRKGLRWGDFGRAVDFLEDVRKQCMVIPNATLRITTPRTPEGRTD